MKSFIAVLIYAIISVAGVTCFKIGSVQGLSLHVAGGEFSLRISWISILGLFFYVVSFLIYMGLISQNQVGYIVPLCSAAIYILTLVSATLFLHEKVTLTQLAGFTLILFGIILLNINLKLS